MDERLPFPQTLQMEPRKDLRHPHMGIIFIRVSAAPSFIFITSFDGINSHIKWIDVLIFKRRFVVCGKLKLLGGPNSSKCLTLTLLRTYGRHFRHNEASAYQGIDKTNLTIL